MRREVVFVGQKQKNKLIDLSVFFPQSLRNVPTIVVIMVARQPNAIFVFFYLKRLSKFFSSGLQRAEPEAAGEDRQVPGDPPGALSA